jgi:hypothetical protein
VAIVVSSVDPGDFCCQSNAPNCGGGLQPPIRAYSPASCRAARQPRRSAFPLSDVFKRFAPSIASSKM